MNKINEKKYPIYELKSIWKTDETSINVMMKHSLSKIEKENLINTFEKSVRDKHNVNGCIATKVKFVEFESWCIRWFNHYTYNTLYTDKEIFESFSQFVSRKKPMQDALERSHYDHNTEPKYCLMGAEDSWRWKICRCEKCQEYGVVTIDH